MPLGPEDIAREQIDRMLVSAGWAVQDAKAVKPLEVVLFMRRRQVHGASSSR